MADSVDLLLRGARLATNAETWPADIAIAHERFAWLGPAGAFDGLCAATVELDGLVALPGLVDGHTHFREPGQHAAKGTYASESRAAAAGGVTTVLTMPNTMPHTDSLAQLEVVRECARRSLVDYGLQFMVTPHNADALRHVRNVPACKLYLDETTGITSPLFDERLLRQAMATGLLLTAHAEADTLDRLLACHRRWGLGPLYVAHLSLAREVEAIRAAKARGQWVHAEVTPHHLFLDTTDAERLGAFGDMRPTLKSAADVAALWAGLADGTIDTIATDHAPHLRADKARVPAPPGVPGLQTMLPLLLDAVAAGRLALADVARLTARQPASIFALRGKGELRVGADADLALVDLASAHTITDDEQLTQPGWTPFAGRRVRGCVVHTVRRGEFILRDGQICATAGGREVTCRDGGAWLG
jgi:dihydroorotase-like cyclic amidohydrolase